MTLLLIGTHLAAMVVGGKIALRHYLAQLRYRRFRRDLHHALGIMKVIAVIGVGFLVIVIVGLASLGAFS